MTCLSSPCIARFAAWQSRVPTTNASRWPSRANCVRGAGQRINGGIQACGSASSMMESRIAGALSFQPFAVWAATIIAFAAFYWSRAIAGAETRCAEGDGTFVQALYLSVKNALVLFAGTRDARVNQAYACLYNGTAERLHIPSRVTFVETIGQFPISAALIFLVLLAVKNRFKIK